MSIYLSVVKDGDVFTIKKSYYNGQNVVGNKTGTLWHDARQMSLQERIDEGIYLRIDVPTEIDMAFATFERVDVTFNEETAEVFYKEIYNLIPLDETKAILKTRVVYEQTRKYTAGSVISFKGKDITLNQYTINAVNSYSDLVALGGQLPQGALVQANDGSGIPLDDVSLKEVVQLICDDLHASSLQFVSVCSAIDAATTYEEAREAAVWDGVKL